MVAPAANRRRGRVLHLIDTTGPGGAETVFLETAHGLRDRGWVSRAALIGPGWVFDNARALGLDVDIVRTRRRLDIGYLSGLRRLVQQHDIDLIHAHLFSPALYASVTGMMERVPVVASFHGASDIEPGIGRRIRYRIIDRAATIVCVSESLRQQAANHLGSTAESLRLIYNGIDTDRFAGGDGERIRQRYGVPADALLIGAVGNVREAKDYATFLRMAARLSGDSRLFFAIAGERTEPLYGSLLRLRDELHLQDRLEFWGFQDDVPAVMGALDVLVISSTTEGFSLAAIQAMAAGTPVIATRSGGPEEIIQHGITGLLVPTGSPESMADGVKQILNDTSFRSSLIQNAGESVRARFSLRQMLDGYDRLYGELLA